MQLECSASLPPHTALPLYTNDARSLARLPMCARCAAAATDAAAQPHRQPSAVLALLTSSGPGQQHGEHPGGAWPAGISLALALTGSLGRELAATVLPRDSRLADGALAVQTSRMSATGAQPHSFWKGLAGTSQCEPPLAHFALRPMPRNPPWTPHMPTHTRAHPTPHTPHPCVRLMQGCAAPGARRCAPSGLLPGCTRCWASPCRRWRASCLSPDANGRRRSGSSGAAGPCKRPASPACRAP